MDTLYDEVRDYQKEILDLILLNQDNIEQQLEGYHLFDISEVVVELEPEVITAFFSHISADFSASIFEFIDEEEAEIIIKFIPEPMIISIIENMDSDEAVDLLKYLNKEGLRILKKFKPEKRHELTKIMAYKEDEIGAFMTDSFLTIDVEANVKQAMSDVTKEAHEVEYISILYITEGETLVGYIRLKDLIHIIKICYSDMHT